MAEDEAGPAALRRRLQQVDPAAAEAIEPNNIRRIIRALEVVEITGRPFSATAPTKRYRRPSLVIGLRDDWTALTERIERTAEAKVYVDLDAVVADKGVLVIVED